MRVAVARGGAVRCSNPAFHAVNVAAMSFTSNALAISPTDWMQSGQEGTSRAASALASLAIFKMAGTSSFTTRITLG